MSDEGLTHLNESGEARMVDVGAKDVTKRIAVAEGIVEMSDETADRFFSGDLPKGDAAAIARVAGIQGAKRTPELIPLAHPITIDGVEVAIERVVHGARVIATVSSTGWTGVEMEAMTAVSISALAIYDMVKGLERGAAVTSVRMIEKSGGSSGTWTRPGVVE